MTDAQQREAAKAFAEHWKGHGYEKGESQSFWLSLLRDILAPLNTYTHLGLENAEDELQKMEEVENACKEMEKGKEKPVSQVMFKAI